MQIKSKKQQGFTIIEIMIVLAIAGLIMLIVFLAVPALQRTSRNTQRKNDTGNILTAIGTFISNNNGTLPAQLSDITTAIAGVNLGYYTSGNVYYSSSAPTICATVGTSSCASSSSELNTEDVIFVTGEVCSGNTSTSTGVSPRSYVLLYEVENSSNTSSEQCIGS